MRVKVVMCMENQNALMSTAILSYLWEERKFDNIELLRPFVLYIISCNCKTYDKIDENFLIKEMNLNFAFKDLPLIIIQSILKRLSGDKYKILIKKNNTYYLNKDLSQEKNEFTIKKSSATEDIKLLIDDLKKYLINKKIIDKNEIDDKIQRSLLFFLEKNGFTIIKNIDNAYKWNNNDTIMNYNICKYLLQEFEKKSSFYKIFYRMIEGIMISNVMYIQFNTNNAQSFKNVDFYIDSPLILRFLELKTKSENQVGKELLSLLIQHGAKIKCFEHNYQEVEGIIENYKFNKFNNYQFKYKDIKKTSYEQTLEFLDDNNYNESDIDIILVGLRDNFKNHNIEIVSCPNISSNIENNIDFDGLTNFIKKNYTRETKDKTIYNDILSINAINMLRNGKRYSTIEQSKAIFVTLNYAFINIIDKYFGLTKYNDVSLCINDAHLTSLLWMKSNKNKLPELKILSSILAGFEIPNNMINKVKQTLLKIETYSPGDINTIMNKILTTQTSFALMEITGGDINKVDEKNILDAIEEKKNKEILKNIKQIENMKKEYDEKEKNYQNIMLEKDRRFNLIINKNIKKWILLLKCFCYLLYITIVLLLGFLFYKITLLLTPTINNSIIKYIVYILSITGYFGSIAFIYPLPKCKIHISKICAKLEIILNKIYQKKYN